MTNQKSQERPNSQAAGKWKILTSFLIGAACAGTALFFFQKTANQNLKTNGASAGELTNQAVDNLPPGETQSSITSRPRPTTPRLGSLKTNSIPSLTDDRDSDQVGNTRPIAAQGSTGAKQSSFPPDPASVATGKSIIQGRITLNGQPLPEKPLPLDPACGRLHPGVRPTTRFYKVGANGELADTFIYVKAGWEGQTSAAEREPAVLDQMACEYVPYVSGLQVNQILLVKNSDPLLHNVHPTPDPSTGNRESNKAQIAGAKPLSYQFAHPEIFLRFKCDVHPWMFAYVGVVEHPYFAVSGEDGTFALPELPTGKYIIEAIHRKSGRISREATVTGNEPVQIDFVFEIPQEEN